MKHLLTILAALLLHSCVLGVARAGDPAIVVTNPDQTFTVNPTAALTEVTGKRLLGGAQLGLTINPYSAGTTIAAGSRFMVIMFSSDFAGTVQGCAYSGAVDAFQAIQPPGQNTVGPVVITRTAGSYRVLDMR